MMRELIQAGEECLLKRTHEAYSKGMITLDEHNQMVGKICDDYDRILFDYIIPQEQM